MLALARQSASHQSQPFAFMGSLQQAAGAADEKSDTAPKRFTRPARMAADLFPPPLSYCWTMIFFEKAFALCEVMLYF